MPRPICWYRFVKKKNNFVNQCRLAQCCAFESALVPTYDDTKSNFSFLFLDFYSFVNVTPYKEVVRNTVIAGTQCCGSGTRCFFDLWIQDPGWGKQFSGLKILKFFDADPEL